MADKQILVTGSSDAPEGYTVPNTVELVPKAVSCVLDGTGASGDFVPVLEVVSDGGVVVAQSPGATVTAGGSVEQSWFPRVGRGSSAAAFAASWVACFDVSTTIASSTSFTTYDFSAATVYTNDPTTFTFSSGSGGCAINATGYYVLIAHLSWDIPAAPSGAAELLWNAPGTNNLSPGFAPFAAFFGAGESKATTILSNSFPVDSTTVGTHAPLLLRQNSGSDATLNLQFALTRVSSDSGNF